MKVVFESLELNNEYVFTTGVFYKGKPFTGIAIDNAQTFTSQYSFSNGKANGRWISYYKNGNLMEEDYYVDGEQVGDSAEWYENGQIKKLWNQNLETNKCYSNKGNILKEDNYKDKIFKKWFLNGSLKYYSDVEKTIFFSPNQETLITIYTNETQTIYDNTLLFKWYEDVVIEYDLKNAYKTWFLKMFEERHPQFESLLHRLILSNDLNIKADAIFFAGYHKIKSTIELIKKCLSDSRIPPERSNFDGSMFSISSHSIAETSQIALKNLIN